MATQAASASPARPRPFPATSTVRTVLRSNHGAGPTVIASCPPGTWLTGGGYSLPSSGTISPNYVEYSGPATNRVLGGAWMVRLHGGQTVSQLYVYALCLRGTGAVPRPVPQARVGTVLRSNHGAGPTVIASCPPGTWLTGGGYSLPSSGTISPNYVEYSGPATNRVHGGAWMVRLHGGQRASQLFVYALCLHENNRFFRR